MANIDAKPKNKKRWKFWRGRSFKESNQGTQDIKPKLTSQQAYNNKIKTGNGNNAGKNDSKQMPSDIYVSPLELSMYSDISEGTGTRRESPPPFAKRSLLPALKHDDNTTHVSSLLKQDDRFVNIELLSQPKNNSKQSNKKSRVKRKSACSKIKGSYLTGTKAFRRLSKWAFDEVDTDKSGSVDRDELYTGMLLVHLSLATYIGPAATKPMSRNRVNHIFHALDQDNTGSLDEEEFTYVMTILCSQVVSRVVITLLMSLLLIPYLTLRIISFFLPYISDLRSSSLHHIGPYYSLFRPYYDELQCHAMTEVDLSPHIPPNYITTVSPYLPSTYFSCIILFLTTSSILFKQSISYATFFILFYTFCIYHEEYILIHIPETFWATLPTTVLRTILVTVFVPWSMIKIDTLFRLITEMTKTINNRDKLKRKGSISQLA